jgi:Poly-gamma-glutamate hydrolase
MPDQYPLMTKLYLDPSNVDGTTYDKRWRRHESIQIVEAQATDNPEGQKIILAVHGGEIERGTSEIALGSVHEFRDVLFERELIYAWDGERTSPWNDQ